VTPIILVFITLFFSIIYPQIQTELKRVFIGGKIKEDEFKSEIKNTIFSKCVPLLLISLATFCLFIPLLKRIFTESLSNLWNLDFAVTSFVFITGLIFIFFIWSVGLTIQLIQKWDNIGKEPENKKMKVGKK
jgi:hypothetical protein